jgi:hypothetical protein
MSNPALNLDFNIYRTDYADGSQAAVARRQLVFNCRRD